jgi:hypothetical protein
MSTTDLIDPDTLRNACNAAFHELGLGWCLDPTHTLAGTDVADCLHNYLAQHQSHMLAAYDADFLVGAIIHAMARCAPAAIDWRELQQRQIGV